MKTNAAIERDCIVRFHDPINSHSRTATDYDRQAADYDWLGAEVLFGLIFEFVKVGESMLDLGIGTGLSSILFHKAGLKIYGLDGSSEMLSVCKAKDFATELKQHDLLTPPFPYSDNAFDHVISIAVFHFLSDLEPVFAEVARIIRAQGIFAFSVFELSSGSQDKDADSSGDDIVEEIDDAWDVKMYRHSDRYITRLLGSNGFTALKKSRFAALKRPNTDEVMILKLFVAQKKKS